MLQRQNILELFGADKNKYHSCIITCYSFDFLFFEQRVLPALRRAGMININVFIDAKMYQQQLASLDGSYVSKQSYSITPIQLSGAFHSKIIMGIGKNNGFLGIGSGNLTNSGISSNDEVWGAFHTYKTESKALPIFYYVYQYLQNLKSFCYGQNTQKWDWLEKNSPWLTELVTNAPEGIVVNGNEKLRVLSNFNTQSIYKELLDVLPHSKLKNITIIAPYYNKNGEVISNLLSDLKPESIDVVVDSRFGTVPYLFEQKIQVKFHDWEAIKNNSSKMSPRLHAKIIQFQFEYETIIFTGSSNATLEALGSKTIPAKNAEMGVLIQVPKAKNWLQELGIAIPEKSTFHLKNYNPELLISNYILQEKFNIHINYAELDLTNLTLYISDTSTIPENAVVVVEKTEGTMAMYPIMKAAISPFTILLKEQDASSVFRVYIANSENQRISNYEKLHSYQLIQRTNPDSKSSKFLEIINGSKLEDSNLETLLEFANFDSVIQVNHTNTSIVSSPKSNEVVNLKDYDKLSAEEFNRNENTIEDKFKKTSSHLTMLEDFLNNMTFGTPKENFSNSEEQDAENAKEIGLSGDNSVGSNKIVLSFKEGQRLKVKLHKTLENIFNSLLKIHNDILTTAVEKAPCNTYVTIENLQAILVGTHLIFMKWNEQYTEERIKIIVKYKSIDDLIKFENIRGINLQRLEGELNLLSNEVAFSADVSALNNISEIVSEYGGVELVSKDETPSISKHHRFFKENPMNSKTSNNLSSKKGFLIHTVSKLILGLSRENSDYNLHDAAKFKAFKKRLFYRVLLLFINVNWSNKESEIAQLFLLNVFFFAMPKNTTYNEVLEELEEFKLKLNTSKSENFKSVILLQNTLKSFLQWHKLYTNNKNALIKEMDRSTIGRIIFKAKFGFARLTSNFNGTVNIKTPLGFFNQELQEFEIKSINGGAKAIMFNS